MKNAELAEYRAMLIAQAALQNERSRGLVSRLRLLFGPPRSTPMETGPLSLPALPGDEEILAVAESEAVVDAVLDLEIETVAEAEEPVEALEPSERAAPAFLEPADEIAFPRREFGLRPDEPLELSEPLAPARRPVQPGLPFETPGEEREPLLLSLDPLPDRRQAAPPPVDLMDDLLDDLDEELDAVADVLFQATGVRPECRPEPVAETTAEPETPVLEAEVLDAEVFDAEVEAVEARPEPRLVAGNDAPAELEPPALSDDADQAPTGARALLLQLESSLTQEWLAFERQLSQDTPAQPSARPSRSKPRASPRQRRLASGGRS